ncbi:hypothetical protein [Microseira wollei]|uniref:ABC transporter related n=1 Tax=Microseira wollei NIES-4236 TaxID=2530354 RepID=A0AAV3XRX1_9CYAN|nr:hypothetical protein [Microseira wollei]GET44578.1 ABC transporter related [Microseira wollei NIES-4236]
MNWIGLCGRGLVMVARATPFAATGYIFIVVFLKLLPVFQVWLSKYLVDALPGGLQNTSEVLARIILLAAVYAGTLAIAAGLEPIQELLSAWLENRAVAEVDRWLMEAGTRLLDLYRIESPDFHTDLRFSKQAAYYSPRLFRQLQQGVGTLITLAGLLLLLARLQPLLSIVLVGTFLPHLIAEQRLNRLKAEIAIDHSKAAQEMDYYLRIATEANAAKEIRVFGLGDFFLQRFHKCAQVALKEIRTLRLKQLRLSIMFTFNRKKAPAITVRPLAVR